MSKPDEMDGMNASDGAFDLSMDDDPWFNEQVVEWCKWDREYETQQRLQDQPTHQDPQASNSQQLPDSDDRSDRFTWGPEDIVILKQADDVEPQEDDHETGNP